jgi:hypothetical protein
MDSHTIVGLLSGGGFIFIATIFGPVITKRLNKNADETTNAEKLTGIAVTLVKPLQERIDEAEEKITQTTARCDECLAKLKTAAARADAAEARANQAEQRAAAAERRADRNDRTNTALINAWEIALPLLAADAEATKFLRVTIRAANQARYEGEG